MFYRPSVLTTLNLDEIYSNQNSGNSKTDESQYGLKYSVILPTYTINVNLFSRHTNVTNTTSILYVSYLLYLYAVFLES